MNAVETDRQAAQITIDAEKTALERNRMGQFATPYPLAVDIARAMLQVISDDPQNVVFGEPACGSGAFFSALHDVFPHGSIASATGIELDPRFADAARELWGASGFSVIEGDFTQPGTIQAAPRPDVILTNPPYVRHHHIAHENKLRLQVLAERVTGIQVSGLAGLYVYFLLAAHAWMLDGGSAAWLIPSEFMDVNYGVAVKRYLIECVTLERIHRFNPADVQFQDALVSSAVVIFRKELPTQETRAAITYGGTVEQPAIQQEISIPDLQQVRKWSSLPAREGSRVRLHQDRHEITLGDLFKIQRGIATGANSFFIMERSRALDMGLPAAALRPVLPSPRGMRQTVIERAADGFPVLEPQLALLDTDMPQERIKAEYPALWNYLASAREAGIMDAYLVRGRKLWYRQEQRPRAPFLCTYMGRGKNENQPFRFIWNKSDATATNVYLMLFPQGELLRMLEADPQAEAQIFNLLNEIAPHDLRDEGRIYGGGLHKIEPKELSNISAKTIVSLLSGLVV